jgi:hypothetical protein
MRLRIVALALASALLCWALTLEATGAGGKDKKDGTKKEVATGKKFEVPKDAIAGTVKTVDTKKASFTIILNDKKDRTFLVDKATEFWGPKGGDRGTGPKGLEDDCMAAGYEIKVVPTKDGKTAKDVYLPVRKSDKKDETKKEETKKKK